MIITISFPGKQPNPKKEYAIDLGYGPTKTYGETCHTMYDANWWLPNFKASDKKLDGFIQGIVTSDHIGAGRNASYGYGYCMWGGMNFRSLRGIGFNPRNGVWVQFPWHDKFLAALAFDPVKLWYGAEALHGGQLTEEYLDRILSAKEAANKKIPVPQ